MFLILTYFVFVRLSILLTSLLVYYLCTVINLNSNPMTKSLYHWFRFIFTILEYLNRSQCIIMYASMFALPHKHWRLSFTSKYLFWDDFYAQQQTERYLLCHGKPLRMSFIFRVSSHLGRETLKRRLCLVWSRILSASCEHFSSSRCISGELHCITLDSIWDRTTCCWRYCYGGFYISWNLNKLLQSH